MTSANLNPAEIPERPVIERRRFALRNAGKFGVGFVLLAILFGAASFTVLLGLTPIVPTSDVITGILIINGIFVAAMIFLVSSEIYTLLQARKKGRAAARMHIRIVGLFGIVAAFPAILVAIIAGITLDLGLDRIFDTRTKSIVQSSISVAESYVSETAATLNSNTINMGFLLMRNRGGYVLDRGAFLAFMTGQAKARGLLYAAIVRGDGGIIVKADLPTTSATPLPPPPAGLMALAIADKPACGGPEVRSLAGCVIKLKALGDDVFLYTLRSVNPGVVRSIKLMEEITNEYKLLESGRLPLQIAFGLLYISICLTILLSAIWMGIGVADRLVEPIRRLIIAADEVAAGNLTVNVPASRSEGELRSLTDTFNTMTRELRTQRDEILDNQEQIDNRRRFTEAVLSGVTAGVIGVSGEGRLSIANKSALELLGGSGDDSLVGEFLSTLSPELGAVVHNAESAGKSSYREQITISKQGRERTLNIQVSADSSEEELHSHVITIDDITDLVSAQRTSAWADVAQRIAHEIKNPLTPIQLSAERIKRRFGKVITEDKEVFDQCTETIIRQVADIGRMVDEFSSFARMPKPTMVAGDLGEPIREAVFLLKVSHPEIEFEVNIQGDLKGKFDSRLLGQAFGNLIKNATEAIEGYEYPKGETPKIEVSHSMNDGFHIIDIIDNGKGLPTENRQRLLEPYMTTREKGTGLGLAIVGKILEEHGGHIELLDAPAVSKGGHGAMIRIHFPALKDEPKNKKKGETNGV